MESKDQQKMLIWAFKNGKGTPIPKIKSDSIKFSAQLDNWGKQILADIGSRKTNPDGSRFLFNDGSHFHDIETDGINLPFISLFEIGFTDECFYQAKKFITYTAEK